MPRPLPAAGEARLGPPDRDEAQACLDAVLTAIDPGGGPTELQQLLIEAAFASMTGHDVAWTPGSTVDPPGLAAVLADRDEAFRTRILQMMILGALVLRPLPADVADRVEAHATELSVDDGMLAVARRFATGQLGLAAFDFARNGYTADWAPERAAALHSSTELHDAWQQSVATGSTAGPTWTSWPSTGSPSPTAPSTSCATSSAWWASRPARWRPAASAPGSRAGSARTSGRRAGNGPRPRAGATRRTAPAPERRPPPAPPVRAGTRTDR
ncbi:MAG: hypothetical protein KDB10_20950 [Acidimicrobiales bacterium]|nr:hypothetical protein [Acidimicrobiales bacterium]MCB9373924.1 hypothetical protein [Microthrixaceae bacterium]